LPPLNNWSFLTSLNPRNPKSALIKLVGYDASPAALDEALAAVRAKTYEPERAPGNEEEDKEGSEGTDVPGAAPSKVSAFSSDAKQVDAASTATEPSLFGDEPVGGAPGPAAGDFFNTLAGDNDTLLTRPRAALVPHFAAATIGSRASSIAGDAPPTPSFPTKSFHMHPKKEDATSALVTRALITGNLDTAVELCIQAGRWADALLLAQGEGLAMRTRMAYFDQAGDSRGYLRVFKGVVQGKKGLADLVRGSEVGEWREMLVVLCRSTLGYYPFAPPPQGSGQYAPPPQGIGPYAPPPSQGGAFGGPLAAAGAPPHYQTARTRLLPDNPILRLRHLPARGEIGRRKVGRCRLEERLEREPRLRHPRRLPPGCPTPGDREDIPDSDRIIFEVLSEHLGRLKQNTPPQQKRMVDDIERRLNVLFDALNCESLSRPVVEQLLTLIQSMQVNDTQGAIAIRADLLTRGSRTDDIGLWMSGVKQLIIWI
ncbi:protein transport protein S31, partial [Ceratobasidium sp. 423]